MNKRRLTDESLYEIIHRADVAHERGRTDFVVRIDTMLALALECVEYRKRAGASARTVGVNRGDE